MTTFYQSPVLLFSPSYHAHLSSISTFTNFMLAPLGCCVLLLRRLLFCCSVRVEASATLGAVGTGATLRANGLVEIEEICAITSRLAVNRAAWKTRSEEMNRWIERFEEAVHAKTP